MYTYEYRFYPKSADDEYINNIYWFIASLVNNGQILNEYQNTVKLEDCYACRVVALEMDSLSEKYWNKYSVKFFKEVEEMSARPAQLLLIGENYDDEDCCTCKSPSHYVLQTNMASALPPVCCGDCNKPVPLYKFPKTYDNSEYYDLLGWQKTYRSCDRQFYQGIGERHGYRMMNDPDSMLSKEALRYCAFFEEKTGIPFFYFLFKYYSPNKPVCPKCGEPWKNRDTGKIHYDYVCHKCRLVSNDIK